MKRWRTSVAFVLVVVVCSGAVFLVGVQGRGHLRDQQVQACERGNVMRAYLLLRAREFVQTDQKAPSRTTELAPRLFPILDCERFMPVRPVVSEEYLGLLRAERLPIMEHGAITRSVDP